MASRIASFLVLCALWVGAQAATPEVASGAPSQVPVFGRVVVVHNGKEMVWGTGFLSTDVLALYVREPGIQDFRRFEIKGDGTFEWKLPPGENVLTSFHALSPQLRGRLWLKFLVPAQDTPVYIGHVYIEARNSDYRYGSGDDLADAIKRLAKPPESEPVKSLFKAEGRVGEYSKLWRVCAPESGLNCDKNHQGVEPVKPARTDNAYPGVETLTPELEWKPSSVPGMKYDLAIYESHTLTINIPGAPRIRGDLVEYAQGLEEPRYRVKTALLPGRKYDWSVRLRRDDAVSTWSTASYFNFFVVGWASGTGLWFGLSTPDGKPTTPTQ